MIQKKFQIKVYKMDGTFVHTFSPDVIADDPTFSSEINNGFGECSIILKQPFDDFDEGNKVAFENIVTIYEFDALNPGGRLIYTGVCTQYVPTAEDASQYVEMSLVGLVQFFSRNPFTSGASYTVDYTAVPADPAQMIKDVIDNVILAYPHCRISYSGAHIDNLGATIAHTFTEVEQRKAIETAFEFMGAGWWWKVDESGQFWLKQKPASATHTFSFAKHIDEATVNKNSESIINKVHFKYTGGTVDVSDATSIATYGKRESIEEDMDIADVNGATNKANKILADQKDPKISAVVTINSSYDLETIKAGETCKILGLKKDNALFSDNMQIVRVDYKVDTVTIHLEEIKNVYGTALADFTINQILQ